MHYLHTEDVIVAQCTSEGVSAINVIRISGKNLVELYKKITKSQKPPSPNTIFKKNIYVDNKLLDQSMVSYFASPNSFTGEDVIEINCHGGGFVSFNIISSLCGAKLARYALPGEFTFRSYYNGKIDLIQAESINDLVNSETNVFANKSIENISGRLSEEIQKIKLDVLSVVSNLEYELDLDENEITHTENKVLYKKVNDIVNKIIKINSSTLFSNIIQRGIRVVLLGRPNVGKSSLFNHLLGRTRSIVSSVAGTTRDTVESVLEIGGYRVKIIDTAGYWESEDALEKMGIEKTREEVLDADLILFLGEKKSDLKLINRFKVDKKTIKILSKSDINKSSGYDFKVCSLSGGGVDGLLTSLSTKIHEISNTKNVAAEYYINKRQQAVINELIVCGDNVLTHIKNRVSHDILANLLHDFLGILNEIISPIDRDDIINNVFSNFCVGK